jgi:hypothetical protein
MTKLARTPEQMADYLDWASNASPLMNGRADAIGHVGMMLTGDRSPQFIEGVQSEILDDEADPGYVKGYIEAWNALAALASGVAMNELHRL